VPPEQLWLAGHTVPQAPQLPTSLAVLTQAPPQAVWPVGQPQRPMAHTWPPVHATPHAPQLALLALVSKHTPPQLVVPAGHSTMHAPLEHT
jgi:hypothetical protein